MRAIGQPEGTGLDQPADNPPRHHASHGASHGAGLRAGYRADGCHWRYQTRANDYAGKRSHDNTGIAVSAGDLQG